MFTRIVFRSVVLLVLGTAICHGVEQAQASKIEPGDSVVTLRHTPIKVDEETLASVPPKTRLLVTSVKGDWGAVTIKQEGKEVSGWVYAKHVRLVTSAPAGSQYPIVLHVIEGKQPGDPPKLYYSRRQAEKVLGSKLPDGRHIMSPRSSFPEGGGGGMRLKVIQCEEDPNVTGQLKGTLGMMVISGKIPMVLQTLPKAYYGAAFTGTKKGGREQSQLSNWAIFEIK